MTGQRPPNTLHPSPLPEASPSDRLLHDLRGPISVIRGHARILIGGGKGALTQDQMSSLLAIERQAQKLGLLLDSTSATTPLPPPHDRRVSEVFAVGSVAPHILIAD